MPNGAGQFFSQSHIVRLLVVVAILWFASLDFRNLAEADEGRYTEIPREMLATGDWVTPRLNALKYFEKPALQYWATAAAFAVFGEHIWTARLWNALTGFFGIALVFFAGLRLFGAQAGAYAGLILASSLLYVVAGHIITLDMGVTFFMNLGVIGFVLAQRPAADPRENWLWMHLAWAAFAMALLSKGLIGLVLPGAALVAYTLIHRDWGLWRRLHLVTGMALFFAIAAPWFVAVTIVNPEFFHFFFIYEHFGRFASTEHGRFQPWWYFLPVLSAGILPWATLMPQALVSAWKRGGGGARVFEPGRFLIVWIVVVFVFFSFSKSKLTLYILPVLPALALLMGRQLGAMSGRALFWHGIPGVFMAAAAVWFAPLVGRWGNAETPQALYAAYLPWVLAAAALWLVAAVASVWLFRAGKLQRGVITIALGSLVAGQSLVTGAEALSPAYSAVHIAERIKPFLRPGTPFYSVGMHDLTLPFYIKRTFTLVAYKGELAFGIEQEPQGYIPDYETFKRVWVAQAYALAIMPPQTFREFEQAGVPMRVIAADARRVVVSTP